MNCECKMKYPKLYEDEVIQIGNTVSLEPEEDKVYLSIPIRKHKLENVIGICIGIDSEQNIIISSTGIIDNVCVTGNICIGDKLTISDTPGVLKALQYEQNKSIFNYTIVGKVIGLYQDYTKAKVLLSIN